MISIPRVNRIVEHPLFQEYSARNALAETQRRFCRHGFDHGLAVARIAYIVLREEDNTSLSKEIIYAAGVLHDQGRWREYETGEDHADIGSELVKPILKDAGYSPEETEIIVQAIREHRRDPESGLSPLGRALAYADDWARDCRSCRSQASCYKYSQEMNQIKS